MTQAQLPLIDRTLRSANACGALQPIRTESARIPDGGVEFTVRWVSTLATRDAARVRAAVRRAPDFNPFLPPEAALTVGPLGPDHVAVLNKYPVIDRHLLIVTRRFELQTVPLGPADFAALSRVMAELGGLGFYNGGTEAGASQRHKHLQWIPETADGAQLRPFTERLPSGLPSGATATDPALPWRHCFVRLPPQRCDPAADGVRLHAAFALACRTLGIAPDRDPMPPYNLLTGGRWLVVIPRRREHHEHISVNALGFAGSLFVRRPEQIETVRRIGPLALLAAVAREP